MALLALAAGHARTVTGVRILCVTVDHGLRPEAAEEARQVKRAAEALGVPHETLRWTRTGDGRVSQARARQARHALLATWARDNSVSRIALGHTRDDRIETFLMRARQGSGWYGLAGPMPFAPSPVWPEGDGLTLVRPLLAFSREDLRSDLRARGVRWIEDPSNGNEAFERVRMRRLVQQFDPHRRDRIIGIMDRLADLRVATARAAHGLLQQLQPAGEERLIPLAARDQVGAEAWRRFLEAMVMAAGGGAAAPRSAALARLEERIARLDPALARGTTLGGARIRIRESAFLDFGQAPPRQGQPVAPCVSWDRASRLLALPDLRLLSI